MFRNQEDHLAHKHRLEDEKKREEERVRDQKKKDRRIRVRRNLSRLLKIVLFFTSISAIVVFAIKCTETVREARASIQLERESAHRDLLRTMKENVPFQVNREDWVWCIDHCARLGERDGERYAEGIVDGRLFNYETSREMISVSGPWLTKEGRRHITIEIQEVNRDLNSPRFFVGDLVRVHYSCDNRSCTLLPTRLHR